MTIETITGEVTLLGDFISADAILPARHSFLAPEDMAQHVLAEVSAPVNAAVRARPIIVAGEAFGYGTGRESPARALRAAGIKAIVGGPFARMFFRNAINNGVLVLDCPELAGCGIGDGDDLTIDVATGIIQWRERTFRAMPVPDIIQSIVAAGSLIDYGRALLEARRSGAAHR